MILPILLYGYEILGFGDNQAFEKFIFGTFEFKTVDSKLRGLWQAKQTSY